MKIIDIYNLSEFDKYKILFEYLKEKEIRENNKTVRLAWEQYKTLVNLTDPGVPPEPIDETQFG